MFNSAKYSLEKGQSIGKNLGYRLRRYGSLKFITQKTKNHFLMFWDSVSNHCGVRSMFNSAKYSLEKGQSVGKKPGSYRFIG